MAISGSSHLNSLADAAAPTGNFLLGIDRLGLVRTLADQLGESASRERSLEEGEQAAPSPFRLSLVVEPRCSAGHQP